MKAKTAIQKKVMDSVRKNLKPFAMHLMMKSAYALQPRAVNLDVTWTCNLRCVMCSAREKVNRSGRLHLSMEKFIHILGQLPKLRHIYFMGLGEPLMNPSFLDFLDYASSKGITASLITNGMLMTENKIKALPDNVVRVSVSIESPVPDQFAGIRKGANLADVKNNLETLSRIRPDIDIHILGILMNQTLAQLPELVRLAEEMKASVLDVSQLMALDETTDAMRVTHRTKTAAGQLARAEKQARNSGLTLLLRPLQPRMRFCWQPWLAPLILLNGDILPCCFMDRSDDAHCSEWYDGVKIEVPFRQYRLGNIFEDDFRRLWNSPGFRNTRRQIGRSQKKRDPDMGMDEFNALRKKTDLDEPHAYCRICLFRWNCSC